MPRQTNNSPAAPPAPGTLALDALPPEIRADLLRQQQESIDIPQNLPRVKILPAGVGQFEFADEPGDTVRSFDAVIIGHHKRNVMWDRRFGDGPSDGEAPLPACSSSDGLTGLPRQGFAHPALGGRVADGFTALPCIGCVCNAFGSGQLVIPTNNPRGKACTNQRSVFVLREGREIPYDLILPPTSLPAFDEYMLSLLNRGIPVQAVVTTISQTIAARGGIRWGVVQWAQGTPLSMEQFTVIREKMQQFAGAIQPRTTPVVQATVAQIDIGDEATDTPVDGDIPPF